LGYYDSTSSGDEAFITNAHNFKWFNHLPRHEHVVSSNLNASQIENLFVLGKQFEYKYNLTPYVSSYMVTPLNEGTWPPYEPLYENLETFGIKYTSTIYISTGAMFGSVKIMPRTDPYISSYVFFDPSYTNGISDDKLFTLAYQAYEKVMANKAIIFFLHQQNFAADRIGVKFFKMLETLLLEQKDYTIQFVPSEDIVDIYHKQFEQ